MLNAGAQFFPPKGPKNSKKKTNNVGPQKDTKDVEIALLKQELVIAKTKLLQLESDKKDLERKNKILSDSIKLYNAEQTQALRDKYFADPRINQSPTVHTVSSSSSSSTGSCSNLQTDTVNRLINYFLDLIEKIAPQNLSARAPIPPGCSESYPPTSSAHQQATPRTASVTSTPQPSSSPKSSSQQALHNIPNQSDSCLPFKGKTQRMIHKEVVQWLLLMSLWKNFLSLNQTINRI